MNKEVLLRGEKPSVQPAVFEDIDESMVKEAALKTKGGSCPSGLDADEWRKILATKNYGMSMSLYPVGIYCSKLTIETLEQGVKYV